MDAHEDLSGGGLWRRDFFELQHFETAEFTNENGLHGCSPAKKLANKKMASSRRSPKKLEMIIGHDGGRVFVEEPGGLRPSRGLPIVFAFFLGDPGRQRLVQVICQRIDVGLIHFAKGN